MLHILHFSGRRQVLLVKERHPIARRYLSIVCLLNCQATSGSAEPKSTFLFGATKAGGGRGRRAGGGRKSRREKPKAPKRGSQRRQRQPLAASETASASRVREETAEGEATVIFGLGIRAVAKVEGVKHIYQPTLAFVAPVRARCWWRNRSISHTHHDPHQPQFIIAPEQPRCNIPSAW